MPSESIQYPGVSFALRMVIYPEQPNGITPKRPAVDALTLQPSINVLSCTMVIFSPHHEGQASKISSFPAVCDDFVQSQHPRSGSERNRRGHASPASNSGLLPR